MACVDCTPSTAPQRSLLNESQSLQAKPVIENLQLKPCIYIYIYMQTDRELRGTTIVTNTCTSPPKPPLKARQLWSWSWHSGHKRHSAAWCRMASHTMLFWVLVTKAPTQRGVPGVWPGVALCISWLFLQGWDDFVGNPHHCRVCFIYRGIYFFQYRIYNVRMGHSLPPWFPAW